MSQICLMIDQILSRISEKENDILKFLNYKKLEDLEFPTEWTMYFIVERFHINLSAVKGLIQKINTDSLIEIPIGLIIRSSLLDSLIALDLFVLSESAEEMEKKINRILISNVINSFNYLNRLNQYEEIQLSDLRKAKNNADIGLEKLLSRLRVKNINELIQKQSEFKNKQPIDIFKDLSKSKWNTFAKCYDYYDYYSKYEHFGISYPMLSRQPTDEKLEIINHSLDYIYLITDIIIDIKAKNEAPI